MTVDHPLDDPVWHALTSHHAGLAEVSGRAARYHPDVSVFASAESFDAAGWDDLADLAGPGGSVVVGRRDLPPPPPDWEVTMDLGGVQLVATALTGDVPAPAGLPVRRLGPDDVAEMTALVELAEPGPFRPRTIEMGTYLGVHEDGRLVGMAGERVHPTGYTEISAVCTHPDVRGRGIGAYLTQAVAQGVEARGEVAFLHAADTNTGAIRLYERLGFTLRCRPAFRRFAVPAEAPAARVSP
jgi:ribosomal protein S18 acetylase RimI-like enzyme